MTLLLYIAFLPRYQLRAQGGMGRDKRTGMGGMEMCLFTYLILWLAACWSCRWGVRQKERGAR